MIMNESVMQPVAPAIVTLVSDRNRDFEEQESLVSQILARLVKTLNGYRIPYKSSYKHQGFIEQNLLDQNVGPKIARTMR